MRLHTLLTHVAEHTVHRGETSVEVTGLAYDSREVQPGDLFVCWQGLRHDGHQFIDDALKRGAVAIVAERPVSSDAPVIVVPDGRRALARLAAAFYGFPSRRLRVIGVTGTNGKTTTTHLIKALLEQAGHKVGLIGTIRHLIGNEVIQSHRTTPESLDLQRLLFHMAERGVDYAVMEVSSHALSLKRVDETEFDVAVFTNLSQDHLDFHENMDEYFSAKARLFELLTEHNSKPNKAVVINVDDEAASRIRHRCETDIGFGIAGARFASGVDPSVQGREVQVRPEGVSYDVVTPAGQMRLKLRLTGRFNVYNSLAAVAVGWHEGIALPFIRSALEAVPGVPGRLERIDGGQDFTVFVDYAHTPDGLQNVLETCRAFTPGRIIVVFGCGGERDRAKRPLMGEIAGRLADVVVITADNPRSEDPAVICKQIEEGLLTVPEQRARHEVIVERRDAIRHAISIARTGDTVVIAGKGHETTQVFHDRTVHFDDREVAAWALKERFGDVPADG